MRKFIPIPVPVPSDRPRMMAMPQYGGVLDGANIGDNAAIGINQPDLYAITGSGSPAVGYCWTEVAPTGSGTYTSLDIQGRMGTPAVNPAFELNNKVVASGTVVRLLAGQQGEYYFSQNTATSGLPTAVYWSGSITSGYYTDYQLPDAVIVRLDPSGPITFRSFAPPLSTSGSPGRAIQILNAASRPSAGQAPKTLTYLNEDLSGTPSMRIGTPDANPVIQQPQEGIQLKYSDGRYRFAELRPVQPYTNQLGGGGSSPPFTLPPGYITSGYMGSGTYIPYPKIDTPFFLPSGNPVAGLMVYSGNIASGQVAAAHISSGTIIAGAGISVSQSASNITITNISGSFALTSGCIVSGFIGNAAVVSGSVASGVVKVIGQSGILVNTDAANVFTLGTNIAATTLGSGSIQSGMIASGAIGGSTYLIDASTFSGYIAPAPGYGGGGTLTHYVGVTQGVLSSGVILSGGNTNGLHGSIGIRNMSGNDMTFSMTLVDVWGQSFISNNTLVLAGQHQTYDFDAVTEANTAGKGSPIRSFSLKVCDFTSGSKTGYDIYLATVG